jgi:RNA polymerase sigma-70 factor (ECF subfamily)
MAVDEVESVVHTAALADEVRRAVHRLPAPEREPILLAYFGDRSYRDTAQMLGVPEGTVKSRIRSGLASLRRALDVEGVQP